MPRTKTIPWEERVSVFLEYRRNGGKVNPVAKRFGIARSTVNVIVTEFIDMGFADRPRTRLSPEYLAEMQERHRQEVMEQLGTSEAGHTTAAGLLDRLDWRLATDELDAQKLAKAEIPPIPEALEWHLRGTAADVAIKEALTAEGELHQRDLLAWRDLRLALEEACQLEERDTPTGSDREPHLLPALKMVFHRAFFDWRYRHQASPPEWLAWGVDPEDQTVLRLNEYRVAVGSQEDHQSIKKGVAGFLANRFRELQLRFLEVERLQGDLILFKAVLEKALGEVEEEGIRVRICPACPYPEARQDPKASTGRNKRRTKQEATNE